MRNAEDSRAKAWSRLTYYDPETLLREMRRVELKLSPGPRLKRSHDLNPHLERRQAALFSYGLGRRLGTTVAFAPAASRDDDHDCVVTFAMDDAQHFWPVQLKELVPDDVNPRASIQGLLNDVAKRYGRSPHLCVAVYVNRRLPALTLEIPQGSIGSLWMFGGGDAQQRRWLLHGDLLRSDCTVSAFSYPAPRVVEL